MPTYKSPRHGVTISDAFHEAANIAPDDIPIVDTFELYHPTLDETIYVVNNYEPLMGRKEADALRDAGLVVEYMAAPGIGLQRPSESDASASGELELVVPNVQGRFSRALKIARGSPDQWEIIERFYDLSDAEGPSQTPMALTVETVEITTTAVRMRCTFSNPANFPIPRTTFRRVHYPSLVR